jgi:DNA-directed RNA polymerase specialized sigma24 family protein
MPADGSVSHWIQLLRSGDHAAAQPLWDRYFRQLEALARGKLGARPLAAADAEDAALSAMDSVFRGIERGRFLQLHDRDNLIRLLVVVTARKVAHLVRDQNCQKRGGERGAGVMDIAIEEVIGNEPTPEFAAQVAEESDRLLNLLGRDDLRRVALWKLEGYTNDEIAEKLGRAPRSVDRKLGLIRSLWEKEMVS